MIDSTLDTEEIRATVAAALAEDVGDGDLTAALIPATDKARASVITREAAIVAGQPWFNAVFAELDPAITTEWLVSDGDSVKQGERLCVVRGPTRSILTGERMALNFLQTLSGTATETHRLAAALAGYPTVLLDTRKTLPGLRAAQKYAVRCGGGSNHRQGLYDAILIKENHIAAAGSILAAVNAARRESSGVTIEVEVESFEDLEEALRADPDVIMLDNFTTDMMRSAVDLTDGRVKLEASGGFDFNHLLEVADTGVDYISVGALTKHVRAIDLSMLVENE